MAEEEQVGCRCAALVRHERELRERGERAAKEALDLQAIELGRRLEILNGHQESLRKDRERFLSRETFEVTMASWTKWHDEVNRAIDTMRGRDKGIAIAWSVVVVLVGAIGVVIGWALK